MKSELWIVKIGSNSLVDKSGDLNLSAIKDLSNQLAAVIKDGHKIILVSSGAVAAGRKYSQNLADSAKSSGTNSGINIQQAKAAIGQPILLQAYREACSQHHQVIAQVLLTKNDFEEDTTTSNVISCIECLLANQIIPIVNENDVTSVRELMFTDNDELACLLGLQFEADKLILLTEVLGLYDQHPEQAGACLIKKVDNFSEIYQVVSEEKSEQGRGGMLSKVKSCQKLSRVGTECFITSLNDPDCLLKILENKPSGTILSPRVKKIKDRKKRILKKFNRAKARIIVNDCLAKLLMENKQVFSLLPVGVDQIVGEFQADDLVEIIDQEAKSLAIGIAAYSSSEAREYLGVANKPCLVHYDFLFNYN